MWVGDVCHASVKTLSHRTVLVTDSVPGTSLARADL